MSSWPPRTLVPKVSQHRVWLEKTDKFYVYTGDMRDDRHPHPYRR